MIVRIPRVGRGSLSPRLFDQSGIRDQAFILALFEATMTGSASQMVRNIARELCGPVVPSGFVDDRCGRLHRLVGGWNSRPLAAESHPFLLMDGLTIPIREQGQTRDYSALLAAAVTGQGYRELIGMYIGADEPASNWSAFFAQLQARGLRGVDFVISPNRAGAVSAIRKHFPTARWQRSQTGTMQAVLAVCPQPMQKDLRRRVRQIFDASDPETARMSLDGLARDWEARAPQAVQVLRASFEDVTAVTDLPAVYRARLRSSRMIEDITAAISGLHRVLKVLPSLASAETLVGAVCIETDRTWADAQRCFAMDAYRDWKRNAGA